MRYKHRRFVDIPHRTYGDDAFWPTLYWKCDRDVVYLATAQRDRRHFDLNYWEITSTGRDFVPVLATQSGLLRALENLFIARVS